MKAIYPGSFDPITYGHLDIILRAAKLFDKIIVGILNNPNKKALFTIEERKEHLHKVLGNIESASNVEIVVFEGLLIDFAKNQNANCIVRGLRAVTDFEIEFQRSLINKTLNPSIETIFITACSEHMLLSSSAVKEVAYFGGNIDFMVPVEVKDIILDKFKK